MKTIAALLTLSLFTLIPTGCTTDEVNQAPGAGGKADGDDTTKLFKYKGTLDHSMSVGAEQSWERGPYGGTEWLPEDECRVNIDIWAASQPQFEGEKWYAFNANFMVRDVVAWLQDDDDEFRGTISHLIDHKWLKVRVPIEPVEASYPAEVTPLQFIYEEYAAETWGTRTDEVILRRVCNIDGKCDAGDFCPI